MQYTHNSTFTPISAVPLPPHCSSGTSFVTSSPRTQTRWPLWTSAPSSVVVSHALQISWASSGAPWPITTSAVAISRRYFTVCSSQIHVHQTPNPKSLRLTCRVFRTWRRVTCTKRRFRLSSPCETSLRCSTATPSLKRAWSLPRWRPRPRWDKTTTVRDE